MDEKTKEAIGQLRAIVDKHAPISGFRPLAHLQAMAEENASLKVTKVEWFHKGRESVLRHNKSGCCCLFNEQDEIVSVCDAHRERENALKAEGEHRCDQRDAALESCGLLSSELARYRRYDKLIEAVEKAHSADIDLDVVRWCEKGKWVSPSTNAILRAVVAEIPEKS